MVDLEEQQQVMAAAEVDILLSSHSKVTVMVSNSIINRNRLHMVLRHHNPDMGDTRRTAGARILLSRYEL